MTRMFVLLFLLFWSKNAVFLEAQQIQIIGRRQQTLAHFVVDMQQKSMHNVQTLLNRLDENNRVLVDVDAQTQTVAYVESLSKLYHDQVNLISMNRSANPLGAGTIQRSDNIQTDELITALSMDWITNKVYLATESPNSRQSGRIEACHIDRWLREEISKQMDCAIILHHDLDSLHSLVVDPLDGFMYWLNRLQKRIERAWMNGQHLDKNPFSEQLGSDQIASTGSLTLDPQQRLLLYIRKLVDKLEPEVIVCTLHQRSSCRPLIQNIQATQLAVFQHFLFWSSFNSPQTDLHVCSHAKCNQTATRISNSEALEIFRIAESTVQPARTNPNPCAENNGNCSHFCLLTPGVPWRSCACPIGVRLLTDQLTCDPRGLQRILLVGATDGIYFLSLDTQDFLPQRVLYQNWTDNKRLQKIVDVDYDPVESLIYWIDQEAQKIRRCRLDGANLMDLPISSKEARDATKLVIDPVGHNLIWLDSKNGRIELINLRPNSWARRTLVSTQLQHSKALAIDTQDSKVYFSSVQSSGISQIERVNLDGFQRESVLQLHGPGWIFSMLVENSQLYWADELGTLMKVHLNGEAGNVQMVAQHLNNPNSIAKSGQAIFYNSLGGRSLHTINLSPSSLHTSNHIGQELTDSPIYGQLSMKAVNLKALPALNSSCLRSNGGCGHICVPISNAAKTHRCLCAAGFELHTNNRNCTKPSNFLVYSSFDTPNDLVRLSTQSSVFSAKNERQMNVPNVSSTPIMLALNPLNEQIVFFIEPNSQYSSNARLIRTNFNGTIGEILLETRALKSLRGIDVDWMTGNIYWSNSQLKRIQLLQADGHGQKTIAWGGIDPRQIVVDSTGGHIYFVDCFGEQQNGNCSIKKCLLSSCQTGGELFVPGVQVRSMTLDLKTNLLFWTNGHQIWSVDLVNKNQRAHLVNDQPQISSLTSYSGQLYFVNKTDGTIRQMRQLSPLITPEVLHQNVGSVQTLLVAHSTTNKPLPDVQISLHECQLKSAKDGCICLPKRNVYHCECSDQEEMATKSGKCTPPTKFVLMALRDQFVRFKISQHHKTFENVYAKEPYQVLPISNVGHPIAIAFDLLSSKRYVYWIDAFDRDGADVKRASDSQSHVEHLNLGHITHCSQFHDIVCDSFGHQLFVSCSKNQNEPNAFVHVFRIGKDDKLHHLGFIVDGDQRSTATQTYPSPRRLAVFNRLKALFYVDENPSLDSPVIVRCTLEGRHCYPLVSKGLNFHQARLSADLATHRLVYSAADGIWSRDVFVETDIRHPLVVEPFSALSINQNKASGEQISYVQVVNVAPIDDKSILFTATSQSRYEDLLFLVANNSTVSRLNNTSPLQWANSELFRRRSELIVVGTWSSFGHLQPDQSNIVCLNATCSHLCVASHTTQLKSRQFECLCPIGFSRSNSDETRCQQNVKCKPWEFACQNGFECINAALKCDKVSDCEDESDESPLRCNLVETFEEKEPSHTETIARWTCDDRRMTISRYQLCDGQVDCLDNSDELYCRCPNPSLNFDCNAWDHIKRPNYNGSDSQCILRSLLCDGRAQCLNVADELPQVCKHHSIERRVSWSESHLLLLLCAIGALFATFLCSICCCACLAYRRSRQKGHYRRCRRNSNNSAELSLHFRRFRPSTTQTVAISSSAPQSSLFPHQYFDDSASVVEVALQAYPTANHYTEEFPIYESATLPHKRPPTYSYHSLPWAHNHLRQTNWTPWTHSAESYSRQPAPDELVCFEGAGEAMATASNAPSSSFVLPAPHNMYRQFHAPPPSVVSCSTYGIAKPVGIRYTFSRPTNPTSTTTSSSSENSPTKRPKKPKRRRKRQRQSIDQTPKSHTDQSSEPLPPPPPYTRNDKILK